MVASIRCVTKQKDLDRLRPLGMGDDVILDGGPDVELVAQRVDDVADMHIGVRLAIVLTDETEAPVTFPGGDMPKGPPVPPRRLENPGGADKRSGLLGEHLTYVVLA